MKLSSFHIKTFISLMMVFLVLLGFQNCAGEMHDVLIPQHVASSSEILNDARKASQEVLSTHCASCHQMPNNQAEPSQILDEDYLVMNQWIVPGNPDGSRLLQGAHADLQPDQLVLGEGDKAVIQNWISTLGEVEGEPHLLTMESLSPQNFGAVAVGQVVSATLTLKNVGDRAAQNITGAALETPFRYKGTTSFPGTGGCYPILMPGASCNIYVEYVPTSAAIISKNLKVIYKDGSKTRSFNFTLSAGQTMEANVMPQPSIVSITGVIANFKRDKVVTFKNTGLTPATALSLQAMVAPFSVIGHNCTGSISSNASCSATVRYLATTAGNHTGKLRLNYYNGAANKTSEMTINGTSSPQSNFAELMIDNPDATSLGNIYIGDTVLSTINITNTGKQAASSFQATFGANMKFYGNSWPGTGGSCGSSIASASSCTAVVAFSPSAAGLINSSVRITYGGGATSSPSITKAFSATGINPTAILQIVGGTNTIDFGTVSRGSEKSITFYVKNVGRVNATAFSVSKEPTGAFSATDGTCGDLTTLNVNQSCSVTIKFAPTVAGLQTSTGEIAFDNGPNANAKMTLSFRGTGR